MPYHWTHDASPGRVDKLRLWPHQSLTPAGFVWFIGATAAMLALPLLAALGSVVLWILMLFFGIAFWGVWHAIQRNRFDRSRHEELTLTEAEIHLAHVPPKGPKLEWNANPHWVKVSMRKDGPIENYLTLRGNGREVEIGAFLTPEEREVLFDELTDALKNARP